MMYQPPLVPEIMDFPRLSITLPVALVLGLGLALGIASSARCSTPPSARRATSPASAR